MKLAPKKERQEEEQTREQILPYRSKESDRNAAGPACPDDAPNTGEQFSAHDYQRRQTDPFQ